MEIWSVEGEIKIGIQELNDLVIFIEELHKEHNVEWDQPINVAKWNIREIISHIWLWDKYSLELIKLFKETRNELIAKCNSLDEHLSFNVGKRVYNIETYVTKFITNHDNHHMKQIQEFLEKSNTMNRYVNGIR